LDYRRIQLEIQHELVLSRVLRADCSPILLFPNTRIPKLDHGSDVLPVLFMGLLAGRGVYCA
jgi:hypothetical protein